MGTISQEGTRIYIDRAYAVHEDLKGHAGVWVTEGMGTTSSTKNKLNVTSFTEAETVSVLEKLPKHIWYWKYCVEQEKETKLDVLYQNNESAMLMKNNGRISVGKGSKHISSYPIFLCD